MPPSSGNGGSMGSSSKANKLSITSLQQQQQQIMAQMQITQQALMLGQNMDSEDVSLKSSGKEMPGILPETAYAMGSSFPLGSKKQNKQVYILKYC
jgi:hypothetical protein